MVFLAKQNNMIFRGIEEKPKKSNQCEMNYYAVFENAVEEQFRHYLRNPEELQVVERGTIGSITIRCKEEWKDGRTNRDWEFVRFVPDK